MLANLPSKISTVAFVITKINCLDLEPSILSKIIAADARNFFVAHVKWILIV